MPRKKKRRKDRRRARVRQMTAVLVVLVCTVIVVIGYRIWSGLPTYVQEEGHELTGHRYLFDETYGWQNIPNWKATTIGKPLSINSQGLRDREFDYAKPPGRKRILVLGDSYTWGYGVGDDETYSKVLEKLVQGDFGQYEVLNAGVSGWGTDQQFLFLLNEGFKYSPDIVVVAHFLNDLQEISHSQMYGLNKPVFLDTRLTLASVPVPKPKRKAKTISTRVGPFELTAALLRTMQVRCREHDCQLVVMRFGSFIDREDATAKQIEHLFASMMNDIDGLPYLNLDAAFAQQGETGESLIGSNRDNHWNSHGHKQAATALYEFLLNRQLLKND